MMLVLGQFGQVARALGRMDLTCFGRARADFETPEAAADVIREHRPYAVINAAAYTAVDAAETDEARALRINAQAVGEVARACAEISAPLVHLSTDYVFDGTGRAPWRPMSPVNPVNAYGRTKLAGEIAVRRAGGPHVILRTSWVVSAHGSNFVKTMRRLGDTRDTLTVVADQIGGLTPARDIAAACVSIAEQLCAEPRQATHHFSGAPEASWADVARAIFAATRQGVRVEDIPSSNYPTPALRPLNSRLDCSDLETDFGITRPDWRTGLSDILKELNDAA